MNKDKVIAYAQSKITEQQQFYATYDGGSYLPVLHDCMIKVYPQSFGRINLVISSHFAYISRVVTRYTQIDEAIDELVRRSLYNFYQDFYFKHRKEAKNGIRKN